MTAGTQIDAAVAQQLRTGALSACVWWDQPVPDRDDDGKLLTKYLRLDTGTGLISSNRLAGPLGPRRKTYRLIGVGSSPGQAAWVLEQATAALLNFIPTAAGWSCHRMTFESSQPVIKDPDLADRWFGADEWDVFAEPLPS